MLEAADLWFRYDRRADWVLAGAGLAVGPGEVVGLWGPSGCGKTTLGRVLTGYLQPQRGTVTVDGVEAPSPGPHPVQMIPQHPELAVDPRWRVDRILAEAGPIDPTVLEGIGVADRWFDRFPHEISGGELARVVVARALLAGPRYLVADEMTAMLDPITQVRLWHALAATVRTLGLGVVAISHDRALIEAVADRVVDLSALGPPAAMPTRG